MKKIFIGVGHGGSDPGAVANGFKEKDLNLDIALACRDELERHEVIVMLSRIKDENDPISEEIKEANAFKPDIAVDVHNNAGGGDGFEGYYQIGSSPSKLLSQCIEREVKAIGQNSRGVKTRAQADGRDYYGFLRQVKATAVLCEFAFVDNAKDMQILDTLQERRTMGVALAKGILSAMGMQWKPIVESKYSIFTGHFKTKADAEKYASMIRDLPGKPYCEVKAG